MSIMLFVLVASFIVVRKAFFKSVCFEEVSVFPGGYSLILIIGFPASMVGAVSDTLK